MTIYGEFAKISVCDALGVSPVGADTLLLARLAGEIDCRTVLDVGTGTGFIAIYLARTGRRCTGVDFSRQAVECAARNARESGVQVQLIISDLFAEVHEQYDLVVFNPPYGNTRSVRLTGYLELFKSVVPRENPFIAWLSYRLIRKQRIALIRRFLSTVAPNLTPAGRVLFLLHRDELSLVNGYQIERLGSLGEMRPILFSPYSCAVSAGGGLAPSSLK